MSCPKCCCCCFAKDDVTKQYPHIQYRTLNTPPQPEAVAEVPEFQLVPMKKIFEPPQLQMEYGESKPGVCADGVITQQPALEKTGHVPRRGVSQSTDHCPTVRQFKPAIPGMDYECRIHSSSSSDIDSEHAHGSWMPSDLEIKTSTTSGPRLAFSLYYDLQRCILTLTLFKAYDLPAKEQGGASDPFVVMHLDPSREEIFQSRVFYKTLNPSFNEYFEFKNLPPDDVRHQTVMFKVYHDKHSKNAYIGASDLPLKDADLYGATMIIPIDVKALEEKV